MDTNTSSRLDSGDPCVKFAIVTDSKTMDSKGVGVCTEDYSVSYHFFWVFVIAILG